MATRQIPFLTLGLLMLIVALHFLVPDKSSLYFSAEDIVNGQAWRIISGHFMHADTPHLFWNCLGLGVLGTLIEQHSRTVFLAALGTGIVAVGALLLSPFSDLQYYCGLSGVLNTVLLVALWLEWKRSHSWLVIAITCGSFAKALIEAYQGSSMVTHISWPPYAWAHVAGLAGGLILVWLHKCHLKKPVPGFKFS